MSSSARDVKRTESADEQRRRRQDETVAIRKNKRIQSLQKRRAMAAAAPTTTAADAQAVAAGGASANNVVQTTCGASQSNSQGTVASVADLPRIAATLKSMTPDERYEATRSVRRLLSRQEQPPAEAVISAGLVPILVAELGLMTEEKTQFEAAWALTNIASTEHTRVIVTAGAVPYLVKLMMSKNPDIREQCLWCLGNVAGDGHDMRDLVLNVPGSLNNLLMNIKHAATASLLSNATWTLSNFCRGKPQPEIATIQPALPYLAKLITHTSMDIVGDACWALSYISDGDDARIQACIDQGIVSTLVRLLGAEKVSVITPALRTIGNIVSGDDQQTQVGSGQERIVCAAV
jgi:importin subunit alpha-1